MLLRRFGGTHLLQLCSLNVTQHAKVGLGGRFAGNCVAGGEKSDSQDPGIVGTPEETGREAAWMLKADVQVVLLGPDNRFQSNSEAHSLLNTNTRIPAAVDADAQDLRGHMRWS